MLCVSELEIKEEKDLVHSLDVTAFYVDGVRIIGIWTDWDPQDARLTPDGEGGTLLKFTVDGGYGREERAYRVPDREGK